MHFPPLPMHIVQDQESLLETVKALQKSRRFAFDSEFIAERSHRPRLCLVQVATEEVCWLVDPISIQDLAPFWQVVLDPQTEPVTHAGQSDMELCYLATGALPEHAFDTQVAAGFCGLGFPVSYASLVNRLLHVRLGKHETLTDWSRRPLTAGQIQYAVDDVRYLLPLHQQLSRWLEQHNRYTWVIEEFRTICNDAVRVVTPETAYRRVNGAGKLHADELAVLRELAAWRENRAIELDRPPRTVLPDHILVELARRKPKDESDLRKIRIFHGSHLRRGIEGLLEAVERGVRCPPEECPLPPENFIFPKELRAAVDIAKIVLRRHADRIGINAELLATTADVQRYIYRRFCEPDTLMNDPLSIGWRGHVLPPLFDRLFAGRIALHLNCARGFPELEVIEMSMDI